MKEPMVKVTLTMPQAIRDAAQAIMEADAHENFSGFVHDLIRERVVAIKSGRRATVFSWKDPELPEDESEVPASRPAGKGER